MKIIFYGARQAGLISLLTLLAVKEEVICVIPDDEVVERAANNLGLNVRKTEKINNEDFVKYLLGLKPDLLICCHGRQILRKEILSIGCINLHPCLFKYKGAAPIERLLAAGETKASVGAHWMTEKLDVGEVLEEIFLEIEGKTQAEVYNELYPVYSEVLLSVLKKVHSLKNIQ